MGWLGQETGHSPEGIVKAQLTRSTEDVGHHVARPVRGLPLAREAADAVEMIAEGHNRRFFDQLALLLADLPQPDAGQQAVAQAAPIFGVARQPAPADKTGDGRGRAALEQLARAVRIRLAEAALLQQADVTHARARGKNRLIRQGSLQLDDLEGKAGGRNERRLHQRGVIRLAFERVQNGAAVRGLHARLLGQRKNGAGLHAYGPGGAGGLQPGAATVAAGQPE
ncbi:hypothetical protein RZS08_11400, partial [Arthrospira platensis SPKY1]|nr:hypothetical protein [Arthrospira platensis SPKY1]